MAVECSVQPFLGDRVSFWCVTCAYREELPSLNISRIVQGFVLVCLHSSVHSEGVQSVHCCVVDCTNDPGWADNVPSCVVGFAVLPQDFFSANIC